MKEAVFKQIMRLIHSERPLTEEQRDVLQGILDSDEREEIRYSVEESIGS